jgi:hypothetical protein
VRGGGIESADEDEVRRPDPVAAARVVGSGVRARCGGERWCDAVGSGHGGVRRDTVGSGDAAWWGVECGVRRGGERWRDAVGSGVWTLVR